MSAVLPDETESSASVPHQLNRKTSMDDFEDEEQDDDYQGSSNFFTRAVNNTQSTLSDFWKTYRTVFLYVSGVIVLAGIHAFLGVAIWKDWDRAVALLVMICVFWFFVLWYGPVAYLVEKFAIDDKLLEMAAVVNKYLQIGYVSTILYLLAIGGVLAFIFIDTEGDSTRLMSLAGLVSLLIISVLCSSNPARIKFRPVFWGLLMQFMMGLLVLRWPAGKTAFEFVANQTVIFLEYTNNGTAFTYGFIANPGNITDNMGNKLQPVLAFSSLQVVVYFGAIVSVLYYLGIIQFVLVRVAWLMQLTMGTTAAESLNAAACVFLGQTEAALLIKPCLITMTDSEIHAVMTAGYACIAGSLFATYINYGACSTYLLSATVMSAPASMAVAKIIMPETKKSKQSDIRAMKFPKSDESGILECISNGAVVAAGYVVAIVANLIVIMALLAFVDAIFSWAGGMVGYPQISLEETMGYVFYPLAYVMGASNSTNATIHEQETMKVAELMGVKTVLNEFIAYQKLGCMVKHEEISDRARMIATYALCGFSNIGSIGIQLGIMSGMCPERRASFARCAVKGLISGSIACFMTACVAGILISDPTPCPADCSER